MHRLNLQMPTAGFGMDEVMGGRDITALEVMTSSQGQDPG